MCVRVRLLIISNARTRGEEGFSLQRRLCKTCENGKRRTYFSHNLSLLSHIVKMTFVIKSDEINRSRTFRSVFFFVHSSSVRIYSFFLLLHVLKIINMGFKKKKKRKTVYTNPNSYGSIMIKRSKIMTRRMRYKINIYKCDTQTRVFFFSTALYHHFIINMYTFFRYFSSDVSSPFVINDAHVTNVMSLMFAHIYSTEFNIISTFYVVLYNVITWLLARARRLLMDRLI